MRIYLVSLMVWIAGVVSATAGTISGTVVDSTGSGLGNATVVIRSLSTPARVGTDVVASTTITTRTAADGTWSATLVVGDYRVTLAGRDSFNITVPDSSDYEVTDLITSAITYTFTAPGAIGQATGINIIGADGESITGTPINFYSYNYGVSTNNLLSLPGRATNITDLVNKNPARDYNHVILHGYDNQGDGGWGVFYPTNTWSGTNGWSRIALATNNWSMERLWDKRGINVLWFGADPTGATDSSSEIQDAFDAAYALGATVDFPPGDFDIGATTITAHCGINADAGTVINYSGTGVALRVGDGSVGLLRKKTLTLPSVVQVNRPPGTWNTSDVGVLLANLYECTVYVNEVRSFASGLKVWAYDVDGSSDGCVYNKIFINHLSNNKRNVHIGAEANAWCNENTFYGGRMSFDSSMLDVEAHAIDSIASGGAGYTVSDTLTVLGDIGTAATLTVAGVDGSGSITSATISGAGSYDLSGFPADPVPVTGGTGAGATFNLSWHGKTTGTRQILIEDPPTHIANSHTFIGCSIEGAPEYLAEVGGQNNMFVNCRWEPYAGTVPRVWFAGANGDRNTILYGVNAHSLDITTDSGSVWNHVYHSEGIEWSKNIKWDLTDYSEPSNVDFSVESLNIGAVEGAYNMEVEAQASDVMLGMVSNTPGESVGIIGGVYEGTNNRRWFAKLDDSAPSFTIGTTYSAGSSYPMYFQVGASPRAHLYVDGDWVVGQPANVSSVGQFPDVVSAVRSTSSTGSAGFGAILDDANDYRLILKLDGATQKGTIGLTQATGGNWPMEFVVGATPALTIESDRDVLLSDDLNAVGNITGGNIKRGTGSPEGVVTGNVGDTYTRTDGGAGTTHYVKESGSGNTGWRGVGRRGVFNVMDYGATADDATDDTVAFQAAVDAAAAAGGGIVVAPAGVYIINTGDSSGCVLLDTSAYSNITISGYGATLKTTSSTSKTFFSLGATSGPTNVTIEGFTFDQNMDDAARSGTASGNCINAATSTEYLVRDCRFIDLSSRGVQTIGTGTVTIESCYFSGPFLGSAASAGCAIYQQDTVSGRYVRNTIEDGWNPDTAGYLEAQAFYMNGWGTLLIEGNTIRNFEKGVDLRASSGAIVRDNTFIGGSTITAVNRAQTQRCIRIANDASYCQVTGNFFSEWQGQDVIRVVGTGASTGNSITGNTFVRSTAIDQAILRNWGTATVFSMNKIKHVTTTGAAIITSVDGDGSVYAWGNHVDGGWVAYEVDETLTAPLVKAWDNEFASLGTAKVYASNSSISKSSSPMVTGLEPEAAPSVTLHEDWLTSAVAGDSNWTSGGTGGSASIAPYESGHPGIVSIATGTGTGDTAFIKKPGADIVLGQGEAQFQALVKIPTLADITDDYLVRVGLTDTDTGFPTNGIYFEYRRSVATTWYCGTRTGGVTNTGDTGVTVTAGQWYLLRADLADDGTSITFYVDGVLERSTSSAPYLPTGVALTPNIQIQKTAGTTARSISADYYRFAYSPTR